jgi:hypothetical protein
MFASFRKTVRNLNWRKPTHSLLSLLLLCSFAADCLWLVLLSAGFFAQIPIMLLCVGLGGSALVAVLLISFYQQPVKLLMAVLINQIKLFMSLNWVFFHEMVALSSFILSEKKTKGKNMNNRNGRWPFVHFVAAYWDEVKQGTFHWNNFHVLVSGFNAGRTYVLVLGAQTPAKWLFAYFAINIVWCVLYIITLWSLDDRVIFEWFRYTEDLQPERFLRALAVRVGRNWGNTQVKYLTETQRLPKAIGELIVAFRLVKLQ